MILSPDLVKLVRSGRKTQHRTPHEPPMKPKRCYAVQTAKGKPAVLHITITDVRGPERLETIDFQGARKEGFRTVEDFRTHWIALHARWNPLELVWVISFELGDTTDRPRLLKARAGGSQYTSIPALALQGAGEEVSEPNQGRYALESEEGLSVARNARWHDHAEKLQMMAQSLRYEMREDVAPVAIRENLRAIERQCRSIQRKILSEDAVGSSPASEAAGNGSLR